MKSEKEQLTLTKTAPPIPYEYTLFPVNGRAIPVTKIDISNNMVTFSSGNIEYIRYNGNIIEQKTGSVWQIVSTYFNNDYTGIRVYKNNLFQSVINDIKNNSSDIVNNKSVRYLLYGTDGDQRAVTNITRSNGVFRFFVDGVGGTEFNEITGLPVRSVDVNGNTLPNLTYVVYKYDGYSHFTPALYNEVRNLLNANGTWKQIENFPSQINALKIWITRTRDTDNREQSINRIWTDYSNDLKLVFFADFSIQGIVNLLWGEGVSYNGLKYTPVFNEIGLSAQKPGGVREYNAIVPGSGSVGGYQIYRRNIFLNFDKSVSLVLTNIEASNMIPIILSSTTNFNRINPTVDKFIITIPNDKPTNRIFVYQSGTNKLVHITDYIPKGTTQNVTIDYTQGINGITSSIIPVNPLPAPVPFSNDFNFISYKTGQSEDTYYNSRCPQGSIVTDINLYAGGQDYVQGIEFSCKNPITNRSDYMGFYGRGTEYRSSTSQSNGYAGYKSLGVGNRDVNYIEFYDGQNKSVIGGGWPPLGGGEKEFRCPNTGRIAGFNIYSGSDINSLEAYCASPTIPKDYNPAISWSKTPKNPIQGGGTNNFSVCRVNYNGYWIPGRYNKSVDTCYYNAPGKVSSGSQTYEFASANEQLSWKDKAQVSSDKKIEGGINPNDGQVSYICKVKVDSNGIPSSSGSIEVIGNEVGGNCFYDYFGGKASTTYQLLSRQ